MLKNSSLMKQFHYYYYSTEDKFHLNLVKSFKFSSITVLILQSSSITKHVQL